MVKPYGALIVHTPKGFQDVPFEWGNPGGTRSHESPWAGKGTGRRRIGVSASGTLSRRRESWRIRFPYSIPLRGQSHTSSVYPVACLFPVDLRAYPKEATEAGGFAKVLRGSP